MHEPARTRAHLRAPARTRPHPHEPEHTRTHPHAPARKKLHVFLWAHFTHLAHLPLRAQLAPRSLVHAPLVSWSLCAFVPSSLRLSSLRPFATSSLCHFFASSLRFCVSSSLRSFVAASFQLFVTSSFRPSAPSSLHHFVPSSLRPFVFSWVLLAFGLPTLSRIPDSHVNKFWYQPK